MRSSGRLLAEDFFRVASVEKACPSCLLLWLPGKSLALAVNSQRAHAAVGSTVCGNAFEVLNLFSEVV